MRILVLGSHDYRGVQEFKYVMDETSLVLIKEHEPVYLREGFTVACGNTKTGVDLLAREWADTRMDSEVDLFSAVDWKQAVAEDSAACLVFMTPCHRPSCAGLPEHPNHTADRRMRAAAASGHRVYRYGWAAS